MRELTIRLYEFAELDKQAQANAADLIAERLAGPWWDSSDVDDIKDTITYVLAWRLGTPGLDRYGEGDFPGIDGVTVDGWDLDRQDVEVSGRLSPDNAPTLPWQPWLDHVRLTSAHGRTRIELDLDYDSEPISVDACEAIEHAVREALHDAMTAGIREYEYKTSPERAREWLDANPAEFTADGKEMI